MRRSFIAAALALSIPAACIAQPASRARFPTVSPPVLAGSAPDSLNVTPLDVLPFAAAGSALGMVLGWHAGMRLPGSSDDCSNPCGYGALMLGLWGAAFGSVAGSSSAAWLGAAAMGSGSEYWPFLSGATIGLLPAVLVGRAGAAVGDRLGDPMAGWIVAAGLVQGLVAAYIGVHDQPPP